MCRPRVTLTTRSRVYVCSRLRASSAGLPHIIHCCDLVCAWSIMLLPSLLLPLRHTRSWGAGTPLRSRPGARGKSRRAPVQGRAGWEREGGWVNKKVGRRVSRREGAANGMCEGSRSSSEREQQAKVVPVCMRASLIPCALRAMLEPMPMPHGMHAPFMRPRTPPNAPIRTSRLLATCTHHATHHRSLPHTRPLPAQLCPLPTPPRRLRTLHRRRKRHRQRL